MVLRDEKERIRLARLSRSIREETRCYIYRSKLQTSEGEPEIDGKNVYLGLTACNKVEACGICLDSECLDRFENYLTHEEQVEFKHCLVSSDSKTFEKYQIEVAKMIREREDVVQRKMEKEIAERKRLEEEKRKKEEEEEAERQRQQLEALAVLKLEQKKRISQQQREFTNKELLEIVNDTDEGRKILEREKLRIQSEMEKVESMETLPELQQIGMRVELFANLKKPQEMKCVEVTLSIADSDGKILESHDCWVDTATEDIAYKIFGTEVSFALKIDQIPENSAFIIELKHFKEKSNKKSTKCWSYIDTHDVFEKISMEYNAGRGGLWQVLLPLAAKPTDPSRKMWNNYDGTLGLFRNPYSSSSKPSLESYRNTNGVLALFNVM
jgi:hypothetical protein